jgi:hypothetical protein
VNGKTVFISKFISEAQSFITPPPEKIIYRYGEYQKMLNKYRHILFTEGLPDISQFDGKQRTLHILDDLMTEQTTLFQTFSPNFHIGMCGCFIFHKIYFKQVSKIELSALMRITWFYLRILAM